MKTVRQRITLIEGLVTKYLPDGEDIFEFPGITRKIILDSLKESYEYSTMLDDFEGKLELIVLKRNISKLYESVNHFLKDILGTKREKDEFDSFVNSITQIRYFLKETYVLLAVEPFRAEIDIKKAKGQLETLQLDLAGLTNVHSEISSIKEKSLEFVDTLQKSIVMSSKDIADIQSFAVTIEAIQAKVSDAQTKTLELAQVVEQRDVATGETEKKISTLHLKAEKLKKDLDEETLAFERIKKLHEEQVKKNDDFQIQIQATIEDANRYGMAGSFRNRKEELKKSMTLWTVLSMAVLTGLVVITGFVLAPLLSGDLDWKSYFVKTPIFISAVWLGWFCTKQYGFTARLLEDYSFKYAISMAFEGYKKAAKDIDEAVLKNLIDLTIMNVSINPVSLYNSKTNHATPYNEMFDGFMKRFDVSVKADIKHESKL